MMFQKKLLEVLYNFHFPTTWQTNTYSKVFKFQESIVAVCDVVNLVCLSIENLKIHALPKPVALLLPASMNSILLLL